MDLTIVIVNWNARDFLRNCLSSIRKFAGSVRVQTIVVDNASRDSSTEMLIKEFPEVLLIESGGNLGFAKANNLALPHVQAPFVLFLNPDTEIQGDALRLMVEFLTSNPSIGALGCKIRNGDGTIQQLGLQWFPSPFTELLKFLAVTDRTCLRLQGILPYHDPNTSGEVKKLFGACLLVRKAVLDQVGSFDERFFMYCEDVDLCYRITSGGWKLYYLADAQILHLGASSSSQVPGAFSVLMGCESFSKFMRKHHGAAGAFSFRAVALFGAHVRLALLGVMSVLQLSPRHKGSSSSRASMDKYKSIIAWALGYRKAPVQS